MVCDNNGYNKPMGLNPLLNGYCLMGINNPSLTHFKISCNSIGIICMICNGYNPLLVGFNTHFHMISCSSTCVSRVTTCGGSADAKPAAKVASKAPLGDAVPGLKRETWLGLDLKI